MKIKLLKLINNERLNKKLVSTKACDSTSDDYCRENYDFAICTLFAYDHCTKEDHAACSQGAYDTCNIDYSGCFGPGQVD